MDSERLAEVMSAIGDCLSKPEISIAFTVKDTQKVRDMVLQSAAEEARRKAEILCKASGVELGDLLRIEYSWIELRVEKFLDMDWMCAEGCQAPGAAYDFHPEDVEAGDTVDFLWEIR